MYKQHKIQLMAKTVVKKKFKVKKPFTLDKLYLIGDQIDLKEGKVKEILIKNKFI